VRDKGSHFASGAPLEALREVLRSSAEFLLFEEER